MKETFAGTDEAGYVLLLDRLASEIVSQRPKTVGIAGAQGTGKSTMAGLLAERLEQHEYSTVVLSLDDFYLPHSERQQLAHQVHPLLATRGVPGTHDMGLMNRVIHELREGRVVSHPVFNKSLDDRDAEWRTVGPCDVLLLEGWCWGARPVPASSLDSPINELETEGDPTGEWRQFVNQRLGEDDYQSAFSNDMNIFLVAPGMDAIYVWRLQQEQQGPQGRRSMDATGVLRFIRYYERITRQMLESMSGEADICIYFNELHGVERVTGLEP